MSGNRLGIAAVIAAALSSTVAAGIQSANRTEWETLQAEVVRKSQNGQTAEALTVAERALAVATKVFGQDHPDTATSLNDLASLHHDLKAYDQAEPLYVRALLVREKAQGADHLDTAVTRDNLATLYCDRGDYGKAEPLLLRSLTTYEKRLGEDHPTTLGTLQTLAYTYQMLEQSAKAERALLRVQARLETAFGRNDERVAGSLMELVKFYQHHGAYEKAEPLFLRALAITEKINGADHPTHATALTALAMFYQSQSRYAKAEPILARALSINEKTNGPAHVSTGESLGELAALYLKQGASTKAEPLLLRALAIKEKVTSPEHPDVAGLLNTLAIVRELQGRYDEAESLYKRAQAIIENALGVDHPSAAIVLENLATIFRVHGEYERAEPLYLKSLSIKEKVLGADHPDTATALDSLATLYQAQGGYAKAELLFLRALAIRERKPGADHPDPQHASLMTNIATSLNNLAALYVELGAYGKAAPLYQRSLAILEKAVGPEHPITAAAIANLAALHFNEGAIAKAAPLHARALAIRERMLGPQHPATANSLNAVAMLHYRQGDYANAASLYERALAIHKESLGAEHPNIAAVLYNLAVLAESQRLFGRAEELFRQSAAIRRKVLGPLHVFTVEAERAGASVALDAMFRKDPGASQKTVDAVHDTLRAMVPEHLRSVDLQLTDGSRLIRETAVNGVQATLHLLAKAHRYRPELRGEALWWFGEASLHSKGRLFEDIQRALDALRARLDDRGRELLDRLREARNRIVRTIASGTSTPQALESLYAEYDRLQSDVQARSREFGNVSRIPSVDEIAALLAPSAIAIDFFLLAAVDGSESHYYALIWTSRGIADIRDLGAAAALEDAIDRYRRAISVPDNRAYLQRESAALAKLLVEPLADVIGNAGHVFLVPDGRLVGVPFDLLLGGMVLGTQVEISLLGSVRDLARWIRPEASRSGEAALVDPDFGPSRAGQTAFARLSSSRAEGDVVTKYWPRTQVHSGSQATKARLFESQMEGPRILHIASHAFQHSGSDSMITSGVALAGANQAADAGILTAAEMAGLPLGGTQLVVLSACETALADSSYADGLLGMQRSLSLAGARAQVLALWKVPSDATVRLMDEFYKRLAQPGTRKTTALAQAKRALQQQQYPEWEWAGFVLYGDPGAMGQ